MIAFAVAALVLIMVPGPDQALITRNALSGGRSGALLTMLGGLLGLTMHATSASVGLSALVLAAPTAFAVLKALGAAYLLWLGLQALRAAIRTFRGRNADAAAVASTRPTARRTYLRQGFLSNALNPKVALFFVTLLPQYLTDHAHPGPQAALLSVTFAVVYVCWFSLYIAGVGKLSALLARPRVRAGIEQVTGVFLIGVAMRLALLTTPA